MTCTACTALRQETQYSPIALLAILLQMAPLKRSNEMMDCLVTQFGDAAEFDGKIN